MYKYKAKAVRIIDGDTIDALIDLGFEVKMRKKIRLWNINTPEAKGPTMEAANKAKKRLKELLEAKNNEFVLISHGYGKYGRCLGEIFIEGENINQVLLKEGLAVKYEEK